MCDFGCLASRLAHNVVDSVFVTCFPPVPARETAELEGSSVACNVVLPPLPPLPGGEVCSCWENLSQTGTAGQSGCAAGEDSHCPPASSVSHQHYRAAFSKLRFVGSSLRPERILASTCFDLDLFR